MPEEITISQAIQRYGIQISGGHLTHLLQKEIVKGRRFGPLWVVDVESLEQWLANRPKRGGYRGRKAHRKPEEAAEAKQQPPAPQETTIQTPEGAQSGSMPYSHKAAIGCTPRLYRET